MREFYRLLKGEWLKQSRSFTFPIVLLTPILAVVLTFLNLYLRYDYLISLEANKDIGSWRLLALQHHFLWIFFLPLAVTIVAFMVHYIEYSSNSWKQLLALPVERCQVYIAKGIMAYILSLIMILINAVLLIIAGKALGFPEAADFGLIAEYSFYQIVALISLISLQCFISSQMGDSNIPLAIGFVGVASSLLFAQSEVMSRCMPYAHMIYSLPDPTIDNRIPILYGSALGILFLILGLFFFEKKEIY